MKGYGGDFFYKSPTVPSVYNVQKVGLLYDRFIQIQDIANEVYAKKSLTKCTSIQSSLYIINCFSVLVY